MMSRIPRRILLLLAVVLCVPAAWLVGNHQSRALLNEQLERVRGSAEQEQLRLQTTIDTLQSEIRQQQVTLEIAESRAASLQAELDESMKQSIDDQAELALYRRIEGRESERGLRVDDLHRIASQPDTLSITLVQAQGRERASGAIGVTLLTRQDGREQRWMLTDNAHGVLVKAGTLSEDQVSVSSESELLAAFPSDDVVKVEPFDLRFFQTLLVKVENITTMDPEYVEIWVLPEGKRLKPQVQRFRWSEIDFD